MATRKKAATKKAASATAAKEEAPAANIIWADRTSEPPVEVKIGMTRIALPDADEQRKGFQHKEAARLIRQIPGYKEVKAKG